MAKHFCSMLLFCLALPFLAEAQELQSQSFKLILDDSDNSFVNLLDKGVSKSTLPGYDCKVLEKSDRQNEFYADDITKQKGKKLDIEVE
jgi:hypothetical protein